MGSGISKALVKPGDCSNEVWKKILQLFDKLDTDGTHSIDDDELMGHIATLHVDNNIARLKDTERIFNNNIEFEKEKINTDLERNIKKLQKEATENINKLERTKIKQNVDTEASIKNLEEMTPQQKAVKIKQTICGKKKSIEFWDFYKYMKNRSDDIPNIIW